LDKKKLTIIGIFAGVLILVVAAVVISTQLGNRPQSSTPPRTTQQPITTTISPPAQTQPLAQPAAPVVADVAAAFPGATIREMWADNQWLLTVPAGWSITVPPNWIANTDPRRWSINPTPAGFTGASGEILPAGTTMRATEAGDIYVRFMG